MATARRPAHPREARRIPRARCMAIVDRQKRTVRTALAKNQKATPTKELFVRRPARLTTERYPTRAKPAAQRARKRERMAGSRIRPARIHAGTNEATANIAMRIARAAPAAARGG